MTLVSIDSGRIRKLVESKGLTQKELAEKSGVSRSQVIRLLKGSGWVKIRAATLEGLARAVEVRLSDLTDRDRFSQYRREVAAEHSKMSFRGLGMPWSPEQSIDDLFLDPRLIDNTPACCACEKDEFDPTSVPGEGELVQRCSETDVIRATDCVRQRDRVVLLGSPGCGKTTIAKYLIHRAAVDSSADAFLPLYVRVVQLAQFLETVPGADVLAYVSAWAAERGCERATELLRERLQSRQARCLVVLDGLDEMGDGDSRAGALEAISQFVLAYPWNSYVLTSRLIGYSHEKWESLGFTPYRICDYDAEEQDELLSKWSSLLACDDDAKAKETLAGLRHAILCNPRVRTLSENPLILTICVLLHQARGGSLPRRRVDFYEKIADVFLDTWESSKADDSQAHLLHSIPLDAREFRWLLARLALAMQKAGRVLAPRWWANSLIREYLTGTLGFQESEAGRTSDGLLRYLSQRSGLFAEQGDDTFAFCHRTVQEYFASLGIMDEADSRSVSDCLSGFFYHADWSEVMRLVATQLTPAAAESLIRRILDDPDPTGRFLRRGELLALRCLVDGATVTSRQLTEQVFRSLIQLGESRWLGLTMEALDVLEGFAGTRLAELAETTTNAIMRTARRVLTTDEFKQLHRMKRRREILEAARAELNEELTGWAMQAVTVMHDDVEYGFVFFNGDLRDNDPEAWLQSARLMLADERLDHALARAIIHEMGHWSQFDNLARDELMALAASELPAPLRQACINTLPRKDTMHGFFRRLLRDAGEDAAVRGACAVSLVNAAKEHKVVANELAGLLDKGTPETLREGAARGLSGVVVRCSQIRSRLVRMACDENESQGVRVACAWSLSEAIGKAADVDRAFLGWLGGDRCPILQRIAVQAVARAIADRRMAWNHEIVRDAEDFLKGLSEPCPEALDSLVALVSERQSRTAYRLEGILALALGALSSQIELAFVFGSVARSRQGIESDVDLFILGDVSLRELSGPLATAEKSLGRRINPVIYSRESFCQKYQSGDPFLADVYRREKIPILGPGKTPTVQDVNDELRTMAAERLAAAK